MVSDYDSGASRLFDIDEARSVERLADSGLSAHAADGLARCAEWTATFPLQRVKKRRRTEAICPMVAPSMTNRTLFFTSVEMSEREPDLASLDRILETSATTFETQIESHDPRLRCLVVVFPGIKGSRLLDATEPVRAIKGDLLRRGILVGEFFPSCPFATTFNPKLFALRSPVPMYVLRTFLESDWRFICQVPHWQEIYRDRFGEPPRHLSHLGSPVWRLTTRIGWRIDAIRRHFSAPQNDDETMLVS